LKEEGVGAENRDHPQEMKLNELADRAGVPARTIRLYITQGLLPGPLRAGRNAAYGAEHLDALAAIKEFQRQGLTLSQIRRKMAVAEEVEQPLAAPVQTWVYQVAPDVSVTIRGDTPPWRLRVIQKALVELQRALNVRDDA
jgi:DNA-binding transcriptional MerR regulator